MSVASLPAGPARDRQAEAARPALEELIRADQLTAIRQGMWRVIAINIVLGLTAALVSIQAGKAVLGLAWFAAATIVNLARIALFRVGPGRSVDTETESGIVRRLDAGEVERHLRLAWIMALLAGSIWAFVPILCDGLTSPQTLFFVAVTCGITAGAVTHATAYAAVPIAFIIPPTLSLAVVLAMQGGFDRLCLAGTILLYLAALVRSSRQSEGAFREWSRLKNEATSVARSLEEAHQRSSELAEQMRRRAAHDPLTGLLNRNGFIQEMQDHLAEGGGRACLLLLDLDGFKSVNDVFGHAIGDRVLAEVAQRFRDILPDGYAIGRLGGDEFAVFYLPGGSKPQPQDLARRLVTLVAEPFETVGSRRLGVSIGIHDASDLAIAEMLHCADEALAAAKAGGPNGYRVFDDTLRDRLAMRLDSERDLPDGLAKRAIEVWFQPIFGGGGRAVAGFEALVRWKHPVHGWIPPQDLIRGAAKAGHSEALLRFIVGDVCAMLRHFHDSGREDLWVAMNVSPREMSQLAVDEIVLAAVKAHDLPSFALEIEITEETAMDIVAVQEKLSNLSRAGIRLAIDDFGVGYSALASLRQLRADRVKIDRCFVTGLADSPDDQFLVQAILNLGRSLKFDVVAEGVETAADLRALQTAGCTFMQGYHLGRPMPPQAVRVWLKQSHQSAA